MDDVSWTAVNDSASMRGHGHFPDQNCVFMYGPVCLEQRCLGVPPVPVLVCGVWVSCALWCGSGWSHVVTVLVEPSCSSSSGSGLG